MTGVGCSTIIFFFSSLEGKTSRCGEGDDMVVVVVVVVVECQDK